MKKRHPIFFRLIPMLLLMMLYTGCASPEWKGRTTVNVVDTHRIIANLTPTIEEYYLSWHALDRVYKDIKHLEQGLLFDPDDRLLDYVQKAGMYIQDASIRIHQRWEQLSVLNYIRPEMMHDYLVLSASGLKTAKQQIDYDLMFLDIYTPFITHDAFSRDLKRARGHIEESVRLLDQIVLQLSPYVRHDPTMDPGMYLQPVVPLPGEVRPTIV